ncbi:MAG: branched-chain amino acid ABC transporter permease [Erysipelotrichaceae bacterium]|nr:branched-chain amino acid ABC transporter permease [Erysipelotrichaceae bacterium]MBP5278871.1 branched-chain amino acid ABC transporter permease [Erysipelotrichaceae bacterium]
MKKYLNSKNIIFLVIIAGLAVAPFLTNAYQLRVLISCELNMIFAMSLNLLMGIGGTVSFGHAAFYSIGAYTTACLWYHFGWDYSTNFIFVILVTGLAGLLLALPMSRITGRYVTIITLSFAEIVNLIIKNWDKVTLGQMGIVGIPNITLFGMRFRNKTQFFYFALIFVIITYVLMNWIVDSKLGRNLQAMRDDSIAAEAMGIKLFPNKVIVFTISAIFAGIAGSLYAHLMTYVEPSTFNANLSFSCISIVVVGGLGNFAGTLIGSLFLTILPEYLRRFEFLFKYRMIAYGLVLVIVMWLNHSIPGLKLKQSVSRFFAKLLHRKAAVEEV